MNRSERRKAEKEAAGNKQQIEMAETLNAEFKRAKDLHQKGHLADAEAAYKGLLAQVPGQPDVHFALGMLNRQIEDLGAAEHHFRLSIASKPDQPHVLNELGVMQQQATQFAAAEATFREALQFTPEASDLWFNLGAAQAQQGRLDEAISSFEKAVEHAGEFAMGTYYIGRCHAMKGDHPTAEGFFRKSLEISPDAYPPLLDLATILGKMERWDEALEAAKHVNTVHPGIPEAMYVLGWAHESTDDKAEAEKIYREILARMENHLQAKIGLARLTGEGLDDLPQAPPEQ